MSRHCHKKPTPRPEVKPNKIPLWWTLWINIETPLYYVAITLYALMLASLPFLLCALFYLIYLK